MLQAIPVEARKSPRQHRSRETVEAILGATARVLASEGYAGASTNRIAAVAGVSVGSLYQYFPNKDALVMAVAEEHSTAMVALLRETAERSIEGSSGDAVRHFVRGMIAAHALDPGLHRALVQQVLHLGVGLFAERQEQVRMLVEAWLSTRKERLAIGDVKVAAFVLVATVESVIHAAVFETPALLGDPRFEEELTRMVLGYLGVREG